MFVLIFVLEIVTMVLLQLFEGSMQPTSSQQPIEGSLLIKFVPWFVLPFMIMCVLELLQMPVGVPAHWLRRPVCVGLVMGFLGMVNAAFSAFGMAGITVGQTAVGDATSTLGPSLLLGMLSAVIANTQFHSWVALVVFVAVSVAVYFPLQAAREMANCGDCEALLPGNALWQGMVLGMTCAIGGNLLSGLRRLHPDGYFVAGVMFCWRYPTPSDGYPWQATRRSEDRGCWSAVVHVWRQRLKPVGSLLTALGGLAGVLLIRQVDHLGEPLLEQLWYRQMLEVGPVTAFLLMAVFYIAQGVLWGFVAGVAQGLLAWLRRDFVFVPAGVACAVLALVSLYVGTVFALFERVVTHSHLLYWHGQLAMAGAYRDFFATQRTAVPAIGTYLAIYIFVLAVGGCVGLFLWLKASSLTLLHLVAGAHLPQWLPEWVARALVPRWLGSALVFLGAPGTLEARTAHGKTALHRAARSGYPWMVRLLLARGARLSARDDDNNTAVHCAAARDDGVDTMTSIIEHLKSLEVQQATAVPVKDARNGWTRAVSQFTRRRPTTVVRKTDSVPVAQDRQEVILCAHNRQGRTALHVALLSQTCSYQTVDALLSSCGQQQIKAVDMENMATGLHIWLQRKCSEHPKSREIIALLANDLTTHGTTKAMDHCCLSHEACLPSPCCWPLETRNAGDETPIHLAAAHPHGMQLVKDILKQDPRAATWETREGKTPLFYALHNGDEARDELIEALVQCSPGKLVNHPCTQGNKTALHMACMDGNLRAIDSLLKHGADPTKTDAGGMTPLQRLTKKIDDLTEEERGRTEKKKRRRRQPEAAPLAATNTDLTAIIREAIAHEWVPSIAELAVHLKNAGLVHFERLFQSGSGGNTSVGGNSLSGIKEAIAEGQVPAAEIGGLFRSCPAEHSIKSEQLLAHAVLYRNTDALRALLEAGADADARPTEPGRPALWAQWTELDTKWPKDGGSGTPRPPEYPPKFRGPLNKQDSQALERLRAASELAEREGDILNLREDEEPILRTAPAPKDPEDPSRDLFPLDAAYDPGWPGSLVDWLRELGANPYYWPLKKKYTRTSVYGCHAPEREAGEGEKANDPMHMVIWDGKVMAAQHVAEGKTCQAGCGAFAIFVFYLYTRESSLYQESNRAMLTRQGLAQWRPFIYYVMQAMEGLPTAPRYVFRGLTMPLDQGTYRKYRPGSIIPWPGSTSTSTQLDVARSFLPGKPGKSGILCAINIHTYTDVGPYSRYPEEEELLLPPGCEFVVTKLVAVPTHPEGLALLPPLSPNELRPLTKVCVVMEQVKRPRLVPSPTRDAPTRRVGACQALEQLQSRLGNRTGAEEEGAGQTRADFEG